jgi:hypothetical protein
MFGSEINLFKEMAEAPKPIPGMRASHWYPSGARVKVAHPKTGAMKVFGGCIRAQVARYMQEAPSDVMHDEESLGVWMAGDQIQDVIEGRWKQAGVFVQSELPIYLKSHNVSGRIDTILEKEQPNGSKKKFGVEVKSKAGYYSQTSYISPNKSANPTDFRPADDHLLQSMIYMHACKTEPQLQPYNIDKWLIAYILRDNYAFNYFELELTDDTYSRGAGYPIIYSKVKPEGFIYGWFSVKDIFDSFEEMEKHEKAKTLPPRDFINVYSQQELQQKAADGDLGKTHCTSIANGQFHKVTRTVNGTKEPLGDFQCAYCNFRSKCWGLGNYKENQFTTLQP